MLELSILSTSQADIDVDSFLTSAAVAHKIPKQTREWFDWKFGHNSYGESILACALDNKRIVGCVALGVHDFLLDGITLRAGLSYETFVHPEYQGQQVFSKLINLAESRAKDEGLSFLINFPNSNSLRGFVKKDWISLGIMNYWLKIQRPFKVFRNLSDIKLPFISDASNYEEVKSFTFDGCGNFAVSNGFAQKFTDEYLNWRFKSYPVGRYVFKKFGNGAVVGRTGRRGKLKELQVLYTSVESADLLSSAIKEYQHEVGCDMVSFPSSIGNRIGNKLGRRMFVKVPSRTNFCYKILDPRLNLDFSRLSLSAASAHTY